MFRGDENETEQQPALDANERPPASPGVLIAVSGGEPACMWVPLASGRRLVFGRSGSADMPVDDARLSRQHWAVAREGEEWVVEDLGSQNGTWLNRERVAGKVRVRGPILIRAGNSVFRTYEDGSRFAQSVARIEAGRSIGPMTEPILRIVDDAGRRGDTLLILGETGTGKEEIAARFHAASGRRGEFVRRNASAVPGSIAESALFGAKRGAFSGADRDQEGLFVAADKGTLFLDEIGDMPVEVQVKLLRVLESGEVTPLGTTKSTFVDVCVVSATHRDLDALVEAGKFGADVRERLARRVVTLPPLRDRPEEIAFLVKMFIEQAVGEDTLEITAEFYEACIAFDWRNRNIRGLKHAVEAAAKDAQVFKLRQLLPQNLRDFVTATPSVMPPAPAPPPPPPPVARPEPPKSKPATPRDLQLKLVVESYYRHHGKVRKVAEELGISRQHAYVLLREAGILFKKDDDEED